MLGLVDRDVSAELLALQNAKEFGEEVRANDETQSLLPDRPTISAGRPVGVMIAEMRTPGSMTIRRTYAGGESRSARKFFSSAYARASASSESSAFAAFLAQTRSTTSRPT